MVRWMQDDRLASRKLVDLIWRNACVWAVWNPPTCCLKLGDFGEINEITGEFDVEGNIIDYPKLAEMLENCKPATLKPREVVFAVSGAEKHGKTFSSSVSGNAQVASVIFEAKYDFGGGSGAVLVAHQPIQSTLPYDLDKALVAKTLPGKNIVTSITMCPAYALYLGSKEDGGITLSLQVEGPVTPGGSAGVGAKVKWFKEYKGGVYREGNLDEPSFLVAFDLKTYGRGGKERRARPRGSEPDDEEEATVEDARPPWRLLDEDGNEEVPHEHGHSKLQTLDGEEWD